MSALPSILPLTLASSSAKVSVAVSATVLASAPADGLDGYTTLSATVKPTGLTIFLK